MTTSHTTNLGTHEQHLARRIAESESLRREVCSADRHGERDAAASLEAENGRLRDEIARLQRLALFGTMTAMTVHEVRNFLTPVVSYGEMAMKRPEFMPKAIARAVGAGRRATEVADAMLRIARGQQGQRTEFSLPELVTETLQAMPRPPARDGIDLACRIPEGLRLTSDRVALQQILLNLLCNARSAVLLRGMPRRIEIEVERANSSVAVRVIDNGVGISREDQSHLFEPFFSMRDECDGGAGGHGLGLAICKRLAESLSGGISVDSKPGCGATFTVRVPN